MHRPFLLSINLLCFVTKYNVYFNINNVLDHLPIQLIMKLDMPQLALTVAKSGKLFSWSNANYTEKQCYKSTLNILLDKINIPNLLECNNMLCYDNHSYESEQYHDQITHACNEATHAYIPVKTCRRESTGLIGWSMEHSYMRETSLFWHNIWKDNDRPVPGIVYDIMKSTRLQYHDVLRPLKRDRADVIQKKISQKLLKNNSNKYWSEIKKIKNSIQITSKTIEGKSSSRDIADAFGSEYQNLCCSVQSDPAELLGLQDRINFDIQS